MFSASHLLLSIHTDLLGGDPQCVLSVSASSHLLLSIHTDLLGGGPQCVLSVSFVTDLAFVSY